MATLRGILRVGLGVGLVAAVSVGCGSGDHPTRSAAGGTADPLPRARLVAIADRSRTACRSPGAAVGVRAPDGRTQVEHAGVLAEGVPLRRRSQLLAGSVTKLFVATVAYQLIGAGRLSLDDTVDQFIPTWPNGDRITVGMLLGHRSGMGDFGNNFGAQLRDLVLADPARVFRYQEVLDLVRAVPPVAEPGAEYHYSNANSIVLGAILQHQTRRSLGDLIDARIIEPLRLRDTIYGPDRLAAADAITFHGLFDVAGTGEPIDIGSFPRAAALTVDPAGAGVFSTLPDLLAFTHALFATNHLLPRPARAAVARSVSTLTAPDLLLEDHFVVHGHGGASPGAQTIVAFDETSGTTVAVWCNRLDPGPSELLPSVLAARDVFRLAAPSERP